MDRKKQMLQLRAKNYTYKQIGDLFGITRQRVYQVLKLGSVNNGRDIIREKVRERDNWTCQMCGKVWIKGTRRLDIHHLDCDKRKSKKCEAIEEASNMITLCHHCHLNIPEHRMSMSQGLTRHRNGDKM